MYSVGIVTYKKTQKQIVTIGGTIYPFTYAIDRNHKNKTKIYLTKAVKQKKSTKTGFNHVFIF